MTDLLRTLLSGIISGVVATIILNNYYWSKKPRLIISDKIAKNSKNEYRIKIVNKSHFYVTNVFIQVQLVTITNGSGGNILNAINIDIPKKSIPIINPYSIKDIDASYAIRLAISKDLDEVWTDDTHTYLKVIVYCSNEHNNASRLYEKIYYKKANSISSGEFEFGKSINIV